MILHFGKRKIANGYMNSVKTIGYFNSISISVVQGGKTKPWILPMPGRCGISWSFDNLDNLWHSARICINEQLSHIRWALATIELMEGNSEEGQRLLKWFRDRCRGECPVSLSRLRRESSNKEFLQTRKWASEYQRLIKNMGGNGKVPMYSLLIRTYLTHGKVHLESLISSKK